MTLSKSFQNWPDTIQANFRKICMESSEHNGAYTDFPTCLQKQVDFWHRGFFDVFLSEYANHSHDFTNFSVCDDTILFSIVSRTYEKSLSNNEQCHFCPIHTKAETCLNAVWLKRFKFVFFLKVVYYTFIAIM